MGKSPTTNHLFDKRIICGNRRLKNLPDLTVRAGLPKTGHALVTNPQTEHTPCLNPNRCRYCPKLDHSGHISCPSTKIRYRTWKCTNCNSSNLIYCITCKTCRIQYVGQTKRALKCHMVEHFGNNSSNDPDSPLGEHYNLPGHNVIDDILITILEFIHFPRTDEARPLCKKEELKWILRLNTWFPRGLNVLD